MAKRINAPINHETSAPLSPSTLLEKSIEKGAGMDQLKELMDLQERWEKKEAKKAFFDALSRFQTLVPMIRKNKTAKITSQKGNYSYKFADLGTISNSIKSPLAECGLSYRWEFQEANGKMRVTCFISHRDGHTEVTTMEAGVDATGGKNDIQQKGSTNTYLQRYTLIGALGLSTADEDNDGARNTTTQQQPDPTREEVIDQWKRTVNDVPRQVELTALYLKNKRVVDGDAEIQAIFKARQIELKETNNPVILP